jgi:hypothetical protein
MSIISASLAALSQWNSGIKPPLAPRPYPCKFFREQSLLTIPDTATNDGSVFRFLPGSITRFGPTGATIYSIAPSELDASATEFLGMAVDTANSRLYMLVQWGDANIRLGWTTLAAKSITTRAAQAVALIGAAYDQRMAFLRAANGVDFVLYMHVNSTTPETQVHTITESTGAITAGAPFLLGGVAPRVAAVGSQRLSYVTADQTIVMQIASEAIWMNRGGSWTPFPITAAGLSVNNNTSVRYV